MKIVKEFIDATYANNNFYKDVIEWHWGLGDDGYLYYKAIYHLSDLSYYGWHKCSEIIPRYFSLIDMKRIIDQFGSLLELRAFY